MTDSFYLEQMGITAARRAFFSYTVEPQGSYGLHVIFRKFLKDKKIVMEEGQKEAWAGFFTDYVVLRLFVARHVLKRYAQEYSPLIRLFNGLEQAEAEFPAFLREEAKPGRGVGDRELLPSHLEERYGKKGMEKLETFFDGLSKKAEAQYPGEDEALKHFLHAAVTALYRKQGVNPNTPVVWFFEEEALAYARYLDGFYRGLIPDEFYETVKFRPYGRDKKEEHIRRPSWRVSAAVILAAAMAAFAVLVLVGT